MFGEWNAYTIVEMRRAELEREAEIMRLCKEIRLTQRGLADDFRAWLGEKMIVAGERLQKPYRGTNAYST